MRVSAIVQLLEEEPIVCELDAAPDPTHHFVAVHNPRRRDGRPLPYLDGSVTTLLVPWHRIDLIQLLPQAEHDNVIGFVRE
jgi:hypothetical protein